ncbi:nitrate- and nitrite sensing domain-containing protein [Halomonas sp. E19]|uniref:nitrate- and nitrite sensing domain-containing protein n=1 Tax=Halomonas sp. E19 TaxID=3397247 RepID=UPI004033C722
MHLFRHISIGHKILLALMLPLLAMGGFAGLQVVERLQLASSMSQLHQLTGLALTAGDLVHELQRERGGSAIFLGTQGRQYGAELQAQRAQTDRRIERFETRLQALGQGDGSDPAWQTMGVVSDHLAGLAALRQRVDAHAASASEVTGRYTELNAELIGIVGRLTHVTGEAQTTRSLAAYYSLLRAKELAGIERALLSGAFGADRIDGQAYQRFVSLIGAQDAQLSTFQILASSSQRALLATQLAGPEVERLEALRETVLLSAARQGFGIDPERWFEWQSVKIDRLKVVEDTVAESVLALVAGLRDGARRDLVRNGVIAAVIAGLVVLVAVSIGRSTVLRLRQTAQAMREIAEGDGDLTRRLSVTHHDEIGSLAAQFNAFAARMQGLLLDVKESAQRVYLSAEEIAQGARPWPPMPSRRRRACRRPRLPWSRSPRRSTIAPTRPSRRTRWHSPPPRWPAGEGCHAGGGRHHGRHQYVCGAYRRDHHADRQHRLPNQHPGP